MQKEKGSVKNKIDPYQNEAVPLPLTEQVSVGYEAIPTQTASTEVNLEVGENVENSNTFHSETPPPDDGFLDEAIGGLKNKLKLSKKKPTNIPSVRDELTMQIEKIMEDGLKDVFLELTPVQKQEFKIKGEKTAMEIRALMKGAKVKIKKIFLLLVNWLRVIPGVNKFFLEQEAKIKADKIIALRYLNPDQ